VDLLLFYVFGAFAVGASLLVVGQRNPMYSVLLLIASFAALAGLYILLEAPFVAVIQIIIYAGAIMVLFVFVVMLLNAPREDVASPASPPPTVGAGVRWVGGVLAAVFAFELVWAMVRLAGSRPPPSPRAAPGSVTDIGRALFTEHAFAFEVTSVLILVAMVGAVVLARKEP